MDGTHDHPSHFGPPAIDSAFRPLLGEEARATPCPEATHDPSSGSGRQQELRFGVQTPAGRNSNAAHAETRQLLFEQHFPLRQNRARECIEPVSRL